MQVVHTLKELRLLLRQARSKGKRVSLVPTMGNLHEGHLRLVDRALESNAYVVATIFVNPLQFGENEDFDAYPRTLERDSKLLEQRGCNLLFAPNVSEVYPDGLKAESTVHVPDLTKHHCGASREKHFDGVATIVSKLFNMVQPDEAVFGEKDFQQMMVIRKLVKDLCFPIEIISVETCREEDGLAKSSRNGYLDIEQRKLAKYLYLVLQETKTNLIEGNGDFTSARQQAITSLTEYGFKLDYFNIASVSTLLPAKDGDVDIVILAAAYMGATRLIDNIRVSL
ncbi:pantoate--beta-alanine ligase [Oleiphilus sp. HI0071]|jgi:pantoate--beta-alanine ligase|uniref:pantoate--beta-alanine ligase n=1 Tax=unclassified Oleiphilus TaxID=2631174 RepID=UPI0007C2FA99|nr:MULTISPECIES: pantoate--beta-alanine ligase [unclassified Oleiphilus]KZY68064.1 pantoate--beta-alanine ligase [Oleiphilus sp. HI0065]KZY89812.1 pantoate--beta-alanine ligase [Oleiphilus sp. HI0071]KZY97195.1 pantoate--beta-alanine ligase [Oleiphilus sp. HI0073]KZZ51650.1 pantoate--beta-alanine ligase [Oleiphilus sp. HI0122]KZZ54821.1 pantoate--beta-alanine ligase [Oleiphilus sp. HI0118]KZZ68946.1 pantoate--beta-alanine ligase [Oleiphilus sp. HI0130]KZZ79993.1 pantoate--beta-alanine ligase